MSRGTLGTGRIAGGTPGLFVAGHVGTIGAYGGFGPVVMHVIEAGVDRRRRGGRAGPVLPPAQCERTSPARQYINIQYLYESAGFSSPQLSARITNDVSTAPDQFDLSTVVLQDGASSTSPGSTPSASRASATWPSKATSSPASARAASSFFAGDDSPAGVYLPHGRHRGRRHPGLCPQRLDRRRRNPGGGLRLLHQHPGAGRARVAGRPAPTPPTCSAAGTTIVPAGSVNGQGTETFRVPFAALPGQNVAFFLDTASSGGTFDPNDMVFTLQSDSDGVNAPTLFPATRGAVTAMIGVSEQPTGSVVQSVDLYGDGGSIFSKQFIAQSVTSTGPLGDLTVLASQGLNNVTAPSIFGNIAAAGPIFGTIQTTGVRTDPVTGADLADPRESRPRLRRPALRPDPSAVRHHHDDRGPGRGQLSPAGSSAAAT